MDDALANQSQEVPTAILEDARGDSGMVEEGGDQQQPDTFEDEPSFERSGVETEY